MLSSRKQWARVLRFLCGDYYHSTIPTFSTVSPRSDVDVDKDQSGIKVTQIDVYECNYIYTIHKYAFLSLWITHEYRHNNWSWSYASLCKSLKSRFNGKKAYISKTRPRIELYSRVKLKGQSDLPRLAYIEWSIITLPDENMVNWLTATSD